MTEYRLRYGITSARPGVWEWSCWMCQSGTGQAPTYHEAGQAAATHYRTNHNNEEVQP